jgi:pantoate kinase
VIRVGYVEAFSPAGITSFFEPYELTPADKRLPQSLRMGARGGGFTIRTGTTTCVTAHRARRSRVEIIVDGKRRNDFSTTEAVAELLLRRTDKKFTVKIEHMITVPVGAGYGASAAGALSTALAMNELLRLGMTFDELGLLAHRAEVRCRTGLGTVGPLMVGGCIVQREGGPPGICRIDRIPVKPHYRIVTGCYGPIPTRIVLGSRAVFNRIGKEGRRAMRSILERPSLENLLQTSEEFASRIGFMTERVARSIALAKRKGSIGATQNMLGEAFHAVVEESEVGEVVKALRRNLRGMRVFSSRIDFEGARLL